MSIINRGHHWDFKSTSLSGNYSNYKCTMCQCTKTIGSEGSHELIEPRLGEDDVNLSCNEILLNRARKCLPWEHNWSEVQQEGDGVIYSQCLDCNIFIQYDVYGFKWLEWPYANKPIMSCNEHLAKEIIT